MLKTILTALLLLIVIPLLVLYVIGKGWLGGPWQSAPVASGPRPMVLPHNRNAAAHARDAVAHSRDAVAQSQILFGDLHNHSNYSLDAYLFNTELVKGGGVVSPADACDLAR